MAVSGADRPGRRDGRGGPARSEGSGARAAAGHSPAAQRDPEIPIRRLRRLRRRSRAQRDRAVSLYRWTKATIENPAKKAKYQKSFTLYVDGDEIYAKDKADALEAELQPLLGGGLITRLAKHDTNPANNPQPPARYRK
jgi:hypothetical protein